MINQKPNPKFLKEKPKMFGLEIEEIIVIGVVMSISNIIDFDSLITITLLFIVSICLILMKRFLPRKYLYFLLSYKKIIPRTKIKR